MISPLIVAIFFLNFSISVGADTKKQIPIYDNTKPDVHCFSSLTQEGCGSDEIILIPKNSLTGCPICSSEGLKAGSDCYNDDKCQYGLTCSDETNKCDFDRSTCAYTYHIKKLYDEDEEEWPIDPNKLPTCEIDGTFAAVQCKGDRINGRCFCYSPEGTRIYGWAWWHEMEANRMSCSCSRLKHKLHRDGMYNTLHCDRMGNYEELQCNDGICWCSDKLKGEVMHKTRAVPQTLWKFLSCYDAKYHGEQYLRQCESVTDAQHTLEKSLRAHGTTNVEFDKFICDYDGGFGHIKNEKGRTYCQWTDGKTIGSFNIDAKDQAKMSCTCARDQKIFEMAGQTHRLTCNGFGNYEPLQNINGKIFCVDNDGFAVNEPIETTEIIDQNYCDKYLYYKHQVKPDTEYNEDDFYADGYGLDLDGDDDVDMYSG